MDDSLFDELHSNDNDFEYPVVIDCDSDFDSDIDEPPELIHFNNKFYYSVDDIYNEYKKKSKIEGEFYTIEYHMNNVKEIIFSRNIDRLMYLFLKRHKLIYA